MRSVSSLPTHDWNTTTSHSTLGQQIKRNGNDVRSVCSLPTHDWNKYTTHTNTWAAKYKQSTGKIRWPASAEKFFNYLLQQLYMGAKVLQPIPFYMNVLYCNILNRYRVCNEIPISRSQSSRQLFYEISKFDKWAALLGGKSYEIHEAFLGLLANTYGYIGCSNSTLIFLHV